MGIGGLVVDGLSYPGVGYGEIEVQKRNRRLADLKSVFERRMVSGKNSIKSSRSCRVPENAPNRSSI